MATKDGKFSLSMEQRKMLEEAVKENKPLEFIETGNIGLDLALSDGKGLPMGASILLWAKPGSGKTTIVADASKRLIRKAKANGEVFKVLYLAVEDSSGLMSALGMDEYMASKDFLYIPRSFCWRQVETFYEAVLNGYGVYEGVKLIVIDSVNNVLSDQNVKNSVADGDFGTKSRERSAFYSKFLPLCKEKGISSFFISQVRQKQAASMYEDPNKAAVSNVDLHNVDIIIKCTALTDTKYASKIEEETVFGTDKVSSKCIFRMDSKATDCKNRFIRGNAVDLLFEKGKCVWNYFVVEKMLLANKLLKSPSSGWYTFDKEVGEAFGLSDTKMRLDEVHEIVQDRIGDFVELLKKLGKYKVKINETEVPVTEEEATIEE